MKKILSLLVAGSIMLGTQAQTIAAGKIYGSIKDGGQQKIIDAATVSLLKAKDSSIVKAAVTDKDGNFIFEDVKDGLYVVLASSIGHTNTYSKIFAISPENLNVNVGTLQLVPQEKNLTGVTVVAKKPFIERKADKTVLNVDAAISNTGSTALEILEKAPGVTVDKDGNVSLKGKQGVQIMIDGKPTFLSSADLTNMLRNMSSNQLDQIEIMTNPSAKYDASGRSGIINIKTKKNKQKGFNGSVTTSYTQGIYAKTSNSLNLNYKTGNVNLFSTFSLNERNNYQALDIYRRYTHNDGSTQAIFDQHTFSPKHSGNYNAKIGADFYVNKKTTIGIVLSGTTNPFNDKTLSVANLKDSLSVLDSIVKASSIEKHTWKSSGINLNFKHTFDSTGKELTADLDYVKYNSNQNQSFNNTTYSPALSILNVTNLKGLTPTIINILSAKIDYTQNLKHGIKMETGIKSSYVTTDNTAGYYNIVGNTETPDWTISNQFNYKENINAAYLNFNKEIKKWSIQTGLRLENTNYNGVTFGNPTKTDSSFKKSYTSLFPTLYLGYNLSEKNQFSFSFGRRINRPDYEDLNPFLSFLDKYTYGAGNPYLKPMYSYVFEMSHTYKQFLTTTLNYSFTRDLFAETFRQQGFATIVSQGNFGQAYDAGISMNAEMPIKKWWNCSFYHELRYNKYSGMLYGDNVSLAATTYTLNVTNQFTFKKGWSAELSGWYRTKGLEGQILILSLGQLNTAVAKQILKTKGTLKLSVRDILNTKNARGDINFQNTQASFRQYEDNRAIIFSFNYRFGKPIKGIQKRKTGGAGEEQNRVKGAN